MKLPVRGKAVPAFQDRRNILELLYSVFIPYLKERSVEMPKVHSRLKSCKHQELCDQRQAPHPKLQVPVLLPSWKCREGVCHLRSPWHRECPWRLPLQTSRRSPLSQDLPLAPGFQGAEWPRPLTECSSCHRLPPAPGSSVFSFLFVHHQAPLFAPSVSLTAMYLTFSFWPQCLFIFLPRFPSPNTSA